MDTGQASSYMRELQKNLRIQEGRGIMSTKTVDNIRLFVKLLVTAWVPIAVLAGLVSWSSETTAIVMAASTATIDAFFRIFGVESA